MLVEPSRPVEPLTGCGALAVLLLYAMRAPVAGSRDRRRAISLLLRQDAWLEQQLAEAKGVATHIALLSHVPPFVGSEDEAYGWAHKHFASAVFGAGQLANQPCYHGTAGCDVLSTLHRSHRATWLPCRGGSVALKSSQSRPF